MMMNRLLRSSQSKFRIRILNRQFTSTKFNLASEVPSTPPKDNDKKGSAEELFNRVNDNPNLLEAIESLAALAKAKTGVDLRSGQKPTMALMSKLAHDSELKQAAKNLMLQLSNSGIEIDPKQAFEALKQMGGDSFKPSDTIFGEGEEEGEGEDPNNKKK